MNLSLEKLYPVPIHIDNEAASGHQPLDTAFCPGVRQCRKQVNSPVLTLKQHFRYTCRISEIAVNLKRRMCIKKIRERTPATSFRLVGRKQFQKILYDFVSMIAIQQTCPKIYFPTDRPSRSFISTLNHRILHSLKQQRMGKWRNLIAGIESVCMRDMSVLIMR